MASLTSDERLSMKTMNALLAHAGVCEGLRSFTKAITCFEAEATKRCVGGGVG